MEADKNGESEKNKARVSLWERLERPAAPPRPTLSAHDIAATAVQVADAEGLEAITMRRLAAELGVAPMAAYRHVAGKGEVLELMIDRVYGEIEYPEATGWRGNLRACAIGIRGVMLRHPWLVRVTSAKAATALTPNRLAVTERTLSALHELGLDADTMMSVYRTVDAYVVGVTQAEIALRELMREQDWATGEDLRSALSPEMTWLLNTGRFPVYENYIRTGARKDDRDWQFENGLDYLLAGVADTLDLTAVADEELSRPQV